MPIIPPDQIDRVRQANDIVEVIKSYFNVQRSGSTFKALCPFHKEKTPSFIINPQRQIYHCFGCGAGGNVISFIMAYEHVDFVTAVKMLAQKAGITLTLSHAEEQKGPAKDVLYEIHEKIAAFYHEQLLKTPAVLKYLEKRNIPNETITNFRIGFAPDQWDTVIKWADSRYSIELLETAGLILSSRNKQKSTTRYDRFRQRLMFPICDEQGRVIGFSGRVLNAADKGGKYVNSPDTPLFHKSRVLYAMDKARKNIAESGEAIICEGQIDVIRCHIAGFTSAVAAQGTAFTEDHARIIKRYADGVIIVFDSDTAGKNSALRAAAVFAQAGLAARIASLPPGEDPDSFITKNGRDAFGDILTEAKTAVDFQIDLISEQQDISSEIGLLRAIPPVVEIISRAGSPVHQAKLLQQAAARLGIPEEALRKELAGKKYYTQSANNNTPSPPKHESRPIKELALIEHLTAEPSLMDLVISYLPLEMIKDSACRTILDIMQKNGADENIANAVAANDPENQELINLASMILAAPEKIKSSFASHEESVKSLILGIRIEAIKRQRKRILEEINKIPADTTDEKLLKQRKNLETDYFQMGYDIIKHSDWTQALPVMETT